MSENKLPEAITIDGQEYKVSSLGPKALHLLDVYQVWEKEARELRLSLAKNEAALRDLTRELSATIKAESEEQAA